ncbi:MAG: hypothetical protein AAFP76_10240 [Bacteroidota bacterium]
MSESTTDNSKTIGIVAYLTLIGWVIAFIMHSNNKTEYGAFHLRQMLGLLILGIALSVVANVLGIAIIAWIIQAAIFVLWLLGFIGAIQGEKKPIPVLGAQFQEWFKGLG